MLAAHVWTVALVACVAQSPTDGGPPPSKDTLQLIPIATTLSNPDYLTAPPGDVNRLFVVEQAGRIRVIQNGQPLATPFLDIVSKVSSGGERGLFSVAFHPNYASSGFLYVDYTDLAGDTRVEGGTLTSRTNRSLNVNLGNVLSFGEDATGELYVLSGNGGVYRLSAP